MALPQEETKGAAYLAPSPRGPEAVHAPRDLFATRKVKLAHNVTSAPNHVLQLVWTLERKEPPAQVQRAAVRECRRTHFGSDERGAASVNVQSY